MSLKCCFLQEENVFFLGTTVLFLVCVCVWRYLGIGPHTVATLFGVDMLNMIEVHLLTLSKELPDLCCLAVNISPTLCILAQKRLVLAWVKSVHCL